MTQNTILLDPTDERKPAHRQRNPRPNSLNGLTIGLLDISKPRGDIFLNEIERSLAIEGATVKRYSKPTYTRVAPTELKQQLASECDIVVEALAD